MVVGEIKFVKIPKFKTLDSSYFEKLQRRYDLLPLGSNCLAFLAGGEADRSLKFGMRVIGLNLFLNLSSLAFSIYRDGSTRLFCSLIRTATRLKSVGVIVRFKTFFPLQSLFHAIKESNVDIFVFQFTQQSSLTMRQIYTFLNLQKKLEYLVSPKFSEAEILHLIKRTNELANRVHRKSIVHIVPVHYLQYKPKILQNNLDATLADKVLYSKYIPRNIRYQHLGELYELLGITAQSSYLFKLGY